jgi:signal transduction histidine kinase
MKRMNLILAALAVALLILTLSLLSWVRQHVVAQIEASVANAVHSFAPREVLHGPGGDTLVRFAAAEALVRRAMDSSHIRDVVATKLAGDGRELPVVPFWLAAREGAQWAKPLAAWRRMPLGDPAQPFGFLYLDIDNAAVRSMNWALGAIALAIVLMLTTLLARVWSQETSIKRTVIELDERRREMIRLERLSLAGQLAAGLLHDLRKPVLHIRHNLDDLTDALGDFAPATAALQDLRHQTQFFFQMLTDSQIERFVQSDRAVEEYVEVSALLDCSLNLVRYERRGTVVVRRDPENLPPVMAHPYRLIQVFSNLILNAYQALEGRGTLTLETEPREGGVLVTLTDDGPGIPAEMLDRVFDPFFTTKPEGQGTGLGLAICRMIAEEMGGELSVQSRAGGPTAFRVFLPVEPPA